MSGSDIKDPSSSGGGGGYDDKEEEEEEVTSSPAKRDGLRQETGQGGNKEPKRVSIFRFGKAKKKLKLLQSNRRRRRRRKAGFINSGGCFGRGGGEGGVVEGCCCLCTKQPQALDSSGESPPTSDPNSKEFTYDMLKVFIEKNDFYAADCNPHLDSS